MGSGKHRWNLSFHHRSTSSSSPLREPEPPPASFICPISGEMMADPVILPSGNTFERSCIQASADLGFTPRPLSAPPPRPLVLIPNSALLSAILSWCDSSSHPRPVPVPLPAAIALVRQLMKVSAPPPPPPLSPSSPLSPFNSSSSDEGAADPASPSSMSSLGAEIVTGITDPRACNQSAALAALRRATRESQEQRVSLCTPRILAALRPLLAVQADAAAALVNISAERENKVMIVRSGAIPPLIDALLRVGPVETREHATAALLSLVMEEENRAAVGALGAVPPLLRLFASPAEISPMRRDAGMTLFHLTLLDSNALKVVRAPGAVRSLLQIAATSAAAENALRRVALMMLCNLTRSREGRGVMMEAGAVEALIRILRAGTKLAGEEREYCVAAVYAMSRGSLRFRGLGRAAGAEEVMTAAGEDEGIREAVREMARRTVGALRGEEVEEEITAEGSVVSDGVLSFRRRFSELCSASGANSAEF